MFFKVRKGIQSNFFRSRNLRETIIIINANSQMIIIIFERTKRKLKQLKFLYLVYRYLIYFIYEIVFLILY